MAALTYAERALRRTLRDIHDGHITLSADVRRYDPHTGHRLPEPVITVHPDRAPCGGTPNPYGAWWTELIDRGWIALIDTAYPRYRTTPLGEQVVAEFMKGNQR